MYKKTIFALLFFLTPIAFIEQLKNDSSSKIINNKFAIIEKKNCLKEIDLLSQKLYSSSKENFFHNY